MNERIFIADKKPEAKSQNPLPQIRRRTSDHQSITSPIDRILFLQRTIGNQAVQKLVKSGTLQAKLRIGQPGDVYEQEADRVAEQVMKMPDVSEVKDTRIQRKCPKCLKGLSGLLGKDKKEENLQAKEISGRTPDITSQTEANINALKGGGQPLPESTRAFFEPRFGRDFSQVRMHTDTKAAESARAVNAKAYTVGHNLVFGDGQFAPETATGRRMVAHELTHVIQQQQYGSNASLQNKTQVDSKDNISSVSAHIQRACGPAAIDEPSGCANAAGDVKGLRYLFRVNCDEFARGNEEDLRIDARQIKSNETVEIHGLASIDGDPEFNRHLSCARALKAKEVIEDELAKRGISAIIRIFNHGAVPGDAVQQRSVVISRASPEKPPSHRCGPDATEWFIRQVNTALTDPAVIAVRMHMANADRLARRYGTTSAAVAEGGTAARVLAEEAKLKTFGPAPPPRNPTIDAQLALGVATGAAATAAVTPTGPFDRRLIDTPIILSSIVSAANGWAALVTHGARYDFKAHVMNHPKSPHCPDPGCLPKEVGTITLCPGFASENCYESDLPGNLFYARIGKYVGFSLNTLQLGSQLAELTDVTPRPTRPAITWDTPDDTAAINLGFFLPLPLTRSALCHAVPPVRGTLSIPITSCEDCPDIF